MKLKMIQLIPIAIPPDGRRDAAHCIFQSVDEKMPNPVGKFMPMRVAREIQDKEIDFDELFSDPRYDALDSIEGLREILDDEFW